MDQELKAALLDRFQVRKTASQKRAFREYVRDYCREAGYPCRVETAKGLLTSNNIVIGDVDRADVVFTAHYDTCALLPFPNFISPLNMPVYLLYQLGVTLILLAVSFLAGFGVNALFPGMGRLGFYAALLLCSWQIMFGYRNSHTANDNTSGVATVLEAVRRMPPELRDRAAFVLFDNEETGLLGSGGFAKLHKGVMLKKPLVNFDCVSDGDNMLFCNSKAAEELPCMGRLREIFAASMAAAGKQPVTPEAGRAFYPSDQKRFPYGSAVAALKKSRFGFLYMDRIHTRRDVVFQEENIDAMGDFICALAADEAIRPAKEAPRIRSNRIMLWLFFALCALLGVLIGFLIASSRV